MTVFANLVIIASCLFLLLCAVSVWRSRNIISALHFIFIANFYGTALFLFGLMLQKASLTAAAQMLILVMLNFILVVIIIQFLTVKAGMKIDFHNAPKVKFTKNHEDRGIDLL